MMLSQSELNDKERPTPKTLERAKRRDRESRHLVRRRMIQVAYRIYPMIQQVYERLESVRMPMNVLYYGVLIETESVIGYIGLEDNRRSAMIVRAHLCLPNARLNFFREHLERSTIQLAYSFIDEQLSPDDYIPAEDIRLLRFLEKGRGF